MKIIQKNSECIGCGVCVAVCPEFWEMQDDAKAKPKLGKKNTNGDFEFEVDEVGCNKDAAESCPVQVISLGD